MPSPAPISIVPRQSRSAELARSIETRAIIGISAPPGYGKTTLAALACDRLTMPTVRYTAELWHVGDFISPLVHEIRAARPDFGRATLARFRAKSRGTAGLEAWSRQLGATFAADLDHVREPLAILIDDVQVLSSDPVFADFLRGVLRQLPPHAHIAIVGRALPELPLAEWIAAGRAQVFGTDDVRFDDDDARTLAAILQCPVPERNLEEIVTQYEGWAAGIALAFAAGELALPTAGGSMPARSAYLLDVNLAALDDELVHFLEATAVFETLDVDLLERDSSLERSRAYLAELERYGIMLEVIRPGQVYRVHPLLREALVARVRQQGPGTLRRAHVQAAGALEGAGRIREALFHLEASGDDEALGRFIGIHAYDAFIAGDGERIARIAKRLSRAGIGEAAAFAMIEAMIARQRGQAGTEDALLRGIAGSTLDDPVGIACRMLLVEDRLARRAPVDPHALAELASVGAHAGPLVELNVHVFSGWDRAIAGDFIRARAHARRAIAIAGDDIVGRTRATALDAYAATALGSFKEADAMMSSTLRPLETSEHVVLLANTLVWYARFALLWGDAGSARDFAERGQSLARELDLPAEVAGIELALAETYANAADLKRCAAACDAAIAESATAWYGVDRERTRALTVLFRAHAMFATGDPTEAAAHLRTSLLSAQVPSAQGALLASSLAAYATLGDQPDCESTLADAQTALARAVPTDALDAAQIADARSILQALAPAVAGAESTADAAALRPFAAFIEERRTRGWEHPLVRALRPTGTVAAIHPSAPRNSALTPRENEILELIAQGLTNREIAQRFTLSPRTVDTHVERVLSKLGANSRTRAVATAIRLGLVAPP